MKEWMQIKKSFLFFVFLSVHLSIPTHTTKSIILLSLGAHPTHSISRDNTSFIACFALCDYRNLREVFLSFSTHTKTLFNSSLSLCIRSSRLSMGKSSLFFYDCAFNSVCNMTKAISPLSAGTMCPAINTMTLVNVLYDFQNEPVGAPSNAAILVLGD